MRKIWLILLGLTCICHVGYAKKHKRISKHTHQTKKHRYTKNSLKNNKKFHRHTLSESVHVMKDKSIIVKSDLKKGVFMPKAISRQNQTSKGYLRDKRKFWMEYSKAYKQDLSRENMARIQKGKAPIVDEQWIKHHKEHAYFIGQTLEHHHLDHKGYAVPLPKELHRGKGNSTYFHKKSQMVADFKQKSKTNESFQRQFSNSDNKQYPKVDPSKIDMQSESMKHILGSEFHHRRYLENKYGW